MTFNIADIVFFKEYQFTDTQETKPHFGLILLPENLTNFDNSYYCAVITSKKPRYCYVLLPKLKYNFFSLDSYVAMDRQDYVFVDDDSRGQFKKGRLEKKEFIEAFKLLRMTLYSPKQIGFSLSKYLKATIIREWKKEKSKFLPS